MMTKENADRCRTIIFDHLKEKGFPEMTDEQILAELPTMYEKLKAEQLIPSVFTFQMFQAIALEQQRIALIFEQMQQAHFQAQRGFHAAKPVS